LWQVADDGTAQFMHDFYAAREAGQLSRAEALRAAQSGFISGRPVLSLIDATGRGGRVTAVTLPQGSAPTQPGAPRAKSFSHPFYWAPFVLMGNWL
jgi:CHAT domain-containing protein